MNVEHQTQMDSVEGTPSLYSKMNGNSRQQIRANSNPSPTNLRQIVN